MKKNKLTFIIILLAVLVIVSCLNIFAHPTQNEHDKELKEILFGDIKVIFSNEEKVRFQAIADAAALCIDQFSPNKKTRYKEKVFDELNEKIGFSFSFNDIDLQDLGNGKNASAKNHRRYTHRGWNYDDYPLQELWKQRKKILTATVNTELFDKPPGKIEKIPFVKSLIDTESACDEMCDAFCQLVYYTHILGDYLEANRYSDEFQQLIPLVRHEDPTAPAMIDEIISLCEILFEDNQENRLESFTNELKNIKKDAETILFVKGGIQTQEQFEEYQNCAKELKKVLKENIPYMLYKTDFFRSKFY